MTLEDDMHRAAKPGHRSGEQEVRAAFTSALIQALEEASQRGAASDEASLAQGAYDKLQFDFPLVSAEELAALAQAHRAGPGFPLTPKYLAVVREGASTADAAEVQPSSSASSVAATATAAEQPLPAAAPEAPSRPNPLLPLYQQLYAAMLVKSLQRALAEWDVVACAQFLGPLLPLLPSLAGAPGAERGAAGLEALGAEAAAARQGEAGAIPQDTPAQQEDSDELAYEPLEGPAAGPLTQHRSSTACADASGAAAWQQEAHLLPALRLLADQLSWHCLSADSVWREGGLMADLAACLRALQQHSAFGELAEDVGEPLLRLAVARLGACPAEVGSFPSLLEALGVVPGATPHPEAARLALSTAAVLSLHLATAQQAQQRKLWQEAHGALLPLAAQQLEGVEAALAKRAKQAASSSRAAAAPGVAAGAGGSSSSLPSEAELLQLAAACQLLCFYVQRAPPAMQGLRLADSLLAGGLFRALVLLFVRLAALPQAEALRRAVLLCCAACPSLQQWAAAVPGFSPAALALAQQQQQLPLQEQAAERVAVGSSSSSSSREEQVWWHLQAHVALWSLLLEHQQAQQPLVGMLEAACRQSQPKVARVLPLLQLMAAVHAVAQRRFPWPEAARLALVRLSETLSRETRQATLGAEGVGMQAAAEAAAAAAAAPGAQPQEQAAAAPAGARSKDSLPADQQEEAKLRLSAGEQAAALAARRAQQLAPAALKLVKELLQKQGAAGKHD